MSIKLDRIRYTGPAVGSLDERGKRLVFRGCDIIARFWLNDTSEAEYNLGNFEGAATLIHAGEYLKDRLAYELAPWPKGMIRLEAEDDRRTEPVR